ncbi:hypothetical protein ACJX0J_009758 [Zea mays]
MIRTRATCQENSNIPWASKEVKPQRIEKRMFLIFTAAAVIQRQNTVAEAHKAAAIKLIVNSQATPRASIKLGQKNNSKKQLLETTLQNVVVHANITTLGSTTRDSERKKQTLGSEDFGGGATEILTKNGIHIHVTKKTLRFIKQHKQPYSGFGTRLVKTTGW